MGLDICNHILTPPTDIYYFALIFL